MLRWILCAALVTAAAAAAVPADAQASSPDLAEAASLYRSAEQAMADKRYDDAARDYGAAYEISKDAILFFKIASALDKGGKCPVAITYYRRYLREGKPSADHQKLTGERIATCEAKASAAPPPSAAPANPAPAAPAPAPSDKAPAGSDKAPASPASPSAPADKDKDKDKDKAPAAPGSSGPAKAPAPPAGSSSAKAGAKPTDAKPADKGKPGDSKPADKPSGAAGATSEAAPSATSPDASDLAAAPRSDGLSGDGSAEAPVADAPIADAPIADAPIAEPRPALADAEPAPPTAEAGEDTRTAGGLDAASDPAAPAYPPPSLRRTGAWLAVGAGIAFVTVGTVLALSAESTEDDIADLYLTRAGETPQEFDRATQDRYETLVDRGDRYQLLSWVSFGAAAATAGAAAYLFLTSSASSEERADEPRALALRPVLSRQGAGVRASWAF